MDKTFSWSGIKKEAKRVRWPKMKDTMQTSEEVLMFTVFFALFFVLCDFGVQFLLKALGIGA